MPGRKYCFVTIDPAMKNIVKFIDDTTLAEEGINDVSIERRECRHSLINDGFDGLQDSHGEQCIMNYRRKHGFDPKGSYVSQ